MRKSKSAQSQVSASQPNKSIWVSAHAGSGKTRNLVTRVSRLLLGGVKPEKILCLTYTTAAATEMRERLMRELGAWSMMPERELFDKIEKLNDGLVFSKRDGLKSLSEARRLFAKVLETPSGLKIQTIHSFCASVLRKFPLEVDTSPNFLVLDETKKGTIISQTIAYLEKNYPEDFENFIRELEVSDLNLLLEQILSYRINLEKKFDLISFCKCFKLEILEFSPTEELTKIFSDMPDDSISRIRRGLIQGSTLDRKQADLLKDFHNKQRIEKLSALEDIFYTKDGKVRSLRNYPSQLAKLSEPHLDVLFAKLQSNFLKYIGRRNQFLLINKTKRLYNFSHLFLKLYEGFKRVDNVLDYDDLIVKTTILLSDYKSKWVQYKLDGGIDHILLDEAQDTSQFQWKMLSTLMDDFFVDQRALDGARTFYAVGDEKQSIYSFQGADIDAFGHMKDFFSKRMSLLGDKIHDLSLSKSFRSSNAIINFVNEVLLNGAEMGVKLSKEHIAHHRFLPGRVELWPKYPYEKSIPRTNWWTSDGKKKICSSYDKLAERIAIQIKSILDSDTMISDINAKNRVIFRKILPGDFLILVRSRGHLFDSLLKMFDKHRLPTAGSDRLFLLDEIAIRDIVSLLKFLDNPLDDLSLAETLKSPLFGFSEQLLFEICLNRENTLFNSISKLFPEHNGYEVLKDLLYHSRRLKPYDLLERILVNHEGRLKMTARLGKSINNALDEFLLQALSYEDTEPPSISGFIKWLERLNSSVKRELSRNENNIRLMTIHGAKGLESQIVVVADTSGNTKSRRSIEFLEKEDWVCISGRDEFLPEEVKTVKKDQARKELEEQNRLFYVAITRAKNWLIICGLGEQNEKIIRPDQTLDWYDRSAKALRNLNASMVEFVGESKQKKLVLEHGRLLKTEKHKAQEFSRLKSAKIDSGKSDLILGNLEKIKSEPDQKLKRWSATGFYNSGITMKNVNKKIQAKAELVTKSFAEYGSIVHLFLQYIPKFNSADYSYLKRMVHYDFSLKVPSFDIIDEAFSEAMGILKKKSLKFLWEDQHNLRELTLAGFLDPEQFSDVGKYIDKTCFYGRLDFLSLTDEKALIIDFKTNSKVPSSEQSMEPSHLVQMAIYIGLMHNAFPDREVTSAILWTKTATLMKVSNKMAFKALKEHFDKSSS